MNFNRKILLTAFTLLLGITTCWADGQRFTVVIDAGHGGHDPGAIGSSAKEKNINLNVALKTGRLIEKNCPDVKVVYTRKTDVFVPLDNRANIANRNKADLFISIHTNALPNGKIARGAETYILGMARAGENLEVAKRENSVILEEKDYKQRYAGFDPRSAESYIIFEFIQNKYMENSAKYAKEIQREFRSTGGRVDKGVHQAGFLVLRKTSMPSVLIELGYISTPNEARYLASDEGATNMANCIYRAFKNYKNSVRKKGGSVPPVEKEVQQPDEEPVQEKEVLPPTHQDITSNDKASTSDVVFKVQFLTSPRLLKQNDPRLKGLKGAGYYKNNGSYNYTYGETSNYNEILRIQSEVRKKFKDAFAIAFKDGEKITMAEAMKHYKKK